ncbi:MarR family winged helix-turn-helix transcriptional regulator [Nesterenkonia marinintestina]|uniref:MarR family winged helix-turn-helix transcriptional regulator n=1 Tax=Nesterenkonia marinintestina TaxID=2979865 RepID=UPI0021C1712D|nr:MarR family winged helix-turn-helix transcriptional regulator [Nesterenkonia sp. GX14115]
MSPCTVRDGDSTSEASTSTWDAQGFRAAAAEADLSDLRWQILSRLSETADTEGVADGPSQHRLAQSIGTHAPTIHNALQGLARDGWITVERSGYRNGRANRYRLHLPSVEAAR